MAIGIREVSQSDRDQIREMRRLLQRHGETSNPNIWQITDEGMEKILREIDGIITDGSRKIIVAESEGRIVGFIQGQVVKRNEYIPECVGFINLLYVHEPFRRLGIGTRLVKRLSEFFEDLGVQEVNLNYILGNREAEKFWSSLGFKPIKQTVNTSLDFLKKCLLKS